MYVIYADELFLENLIIDYILLIVTSRLSGIAARRLRVLAAAMLGAVYALLAALSGAGFWVTWAFKLGVGLLMVTVVFGATQNLLRVCLVFFGVSAAFAGAVMASAIVRGEGLAPAAVGRVSLVGLLLAFAVFYVLFSAVFRSVTRHRAHGNIGTLTVTYRGRRASIPALLDTGNGLREPVSGLPVAVCALKSALPLFDGPAAEILGREPDPYRALEALYDAGIYSFLLVPYRAVGVSSGMLLAFRPDGMRLGTRELSCLVALSPEDVGQGSGYSAIVGA